MSTLVIGGAGSVGRRYCAILEYLGERYQVMEYSDPEPPQTSYDKAIIAVPTDVHYVYCKRMAELKKTFLCEKPLAFDKEECKELESIENGYMVNNYQYVVNEYHQGTKRPTLLYDYYNTGKNGTWWDVCQLLYINPDAVIRTRSPLWLFAVDDQFVPYIKLEQSYLNMVSDFLNDKYSNLWTMEDGKKMTDVVLSRIKHESSFRYSV